MRPELPPESPPEAPKDKPEDEYKDPLFPIAKEDVGPLVGGVLMFIMTVALVYYVYIGPSPFEMWFSMLKSHDQAQSQTLPKPVQGMMPAEAVSKPPPVQTASPQAKSSTVPSSEPPSAETPAVPDGSEAPETPEKAK